DIARSSILRQYPHRLRQDAPTSRVRVRQLAESKGMLRLLTSHYELFLVFAETKTRVRCSMSGRELSGSSSAKLPKARGVSCEANQIIPRDCFSPVGLLSSLFRPKAQTFSRRCRDKPECCQPDGPGQRYFPSRYVWR